VDLFGSNTHVFILRLWLEPREIEDGEPEWRGVIEHIESGDHSAFRNLEVMLSFITKHLDVSNGNEK
jgi:hypothetical protein